MKRWIVVAAAAVAVVAAVGPGGAEGVGFGGPQGGGGQAATNAKALKIGMVTDVGGLNDRGFNHLAYVGLLAAKAKLKITPYVLQSKSGNDYIPNLTPC